MGNHLAVFQHHQTGDAAHTKLRGQLRVFVAVNAEKGSCGACLSNMAVAPDGTVLPCQSWLTGHGLGHILRTPWNRIWRSPECCAIRMESARMKRLCQLGDTPMQEGF